MVRSLCSSLLANRGLLEGLGCFRVSERPFLCRILLSVGDHLLLQDFRLLRLGILRLPTIHPASPVSCGNHHYGATRYSRPCLPGGALGG